MRVDGLRRPFELTLGIEELAGLTLVLATSAVVFALWLSPDRAWLHPELVAIGSRISSAPRGLGSAVALVLDWAQLAGEPQRARQVTGLFEVVDALARPWMAHVFAHPALSVTTVLYAVLVPTLLWRSLRLFGLSAGSALVFCAFLIATTGFLSNVFAYIHAGKPLSFILLAATVFLLAKYADSKRAAPLLALAGVLFLGLFTDELMLWNIVFIPAALFLLDAHRPLSRVAWALGGALAAYAASLLLILPWLQVTLGHSVKPTGVFAIDSEHPIFRMFAHLLRLDFYEMAIRVTARPLLASIGYASNNTVATSLVAAGILISIGVLVMLLRFRNDRTWQLAAVSLLGWCSFASFGTWLIWFHGRPAGLEGYVAVNYYYNSPVTLFVILFGAAIFKVADRLVGDGTGGRSAIVTPVFVVVVGGAIISSLVMFTRLNDVIRFVHIGPIDTLTFFDVASDGYRVPAPALTISTGDEQRLERMLVRVRREGMQLFGGYFRDSVNAAYYDRSYFDNGMQWFGSSFVQFGAQYGKALCTTYFGDAPCPVNFQASSTP